MVLCHWDADPFDIPSIILTSGFIIDVKIIEGIWEVHIKTRKNAIVEYLDYQIPVPQLNGDMQAAKRD